MSFDYLFKVVLLGDGGVGKTSIGNRYCYGKFSEDYLMTIGVNFFTKVVQYDNKSIKLQIWDIAGQKRFKEIRSIYYNGARAGILVFDITNRESFDGLDNWVWEFQEKVWNVPLVLVGNKVDLEDRVVEVEEARNYANQLNALYLEVSAKSGVNIEQLFSTVIECCLHEDKYKTVIIPKVNALPLDQAFSELEEVIRNYDNNEVIKTALKITRYSIFKKNALSEVISEITSIINFLERGYSLTPEMKEGIIERIRYWSSVQY